MQRTKDMTTGKPVGLIIRFALPFMLGNIFQQLYTVTDTAVVGKALGVQALAALGAVDWLNWLMLGIVTGLTQGFSIPMSREFGAKNYDELRRVIDNAGYIAAASTLLLLLAGQLSARPVLMLMGTPAEVMENALLYLRIMYCGIPAVMAVNYMASILRSMGDSRTPLEATAVASLTNIALDLLFVLVFGWGIAGAAVATVIAQVISGVYCFVQVRKNDIFRHSARSFDAVLSWDIVAVSLPILLQYLIIGFGGLVVQAAANREGIVFIAGFTASNKLYGLIEMAATSYGSAMLTYCGQNYGAGKLDRIKSGMRDSWLISTLTAVGIGVLMLVFGRFILSWFISGTAEEYGAAMEIAYRNLSLMSIFLPVLYYIYVTGSGIRGLGNTVLPMVSGIAELVMRCTMVNILPPLFGPNGILYVEITAWVAGALVLLVSWRIVFGRVEKQLAAAQ